MSTVVVLDTGPLGLVTNPKQTGENLACYQWLEGLVAEERRILVPEIADYEVRRELLRADKTKGLKRLDTVIATLEYVPITSVAMRKAAELWAEARKQGKQTASDVALDGDMILVAQVINLGLPDVVIATTNPGHLSRFITAKAWRDIP